MANGERGEVEVVVREKRYTLKLSMNAACSLQERTGKEVGQILAEAGRLNFSSMRLIMWMLLQKYHAAEFPTELIVGEWIDDAGGPVVFLHTLGQLSQVNRQDEPEGQSAKADTANPLPAHTH